MTLVTTDARNNLRKHSDQSAADTELVLLTPLSKRNKSQKFLWVSIKYSATPVHLGITIEIASGLGAAFDTLILAGNANDTDVFFEFQQKALLPFIDQIRVTAPAGGVGITATIVVQMLELE